MQFARKYITIAANSDFTMVVNSGTQVVRLISGVYQFENRPDDVFDFVPESGNADDIKVSDTDFFFTKSAISLSDLSAAINTLAENDDALSESIEEIKASMLSVMSYKNLADVPETFPPSEHQHTPQILFGVYTLAQTYNLMVSHLGTGPWRRLVSGSISGNNICYAECNGAGVISLYTQGNAGTHSVKNITAATGGTWGIAISFHI